METWMHQQIAKSSGENMKTLEIGAGTLNHLKYEKSGHYDIVEPFDLLYKNSPELFKINNIFHDIEQISTDMKYDRIISTAVFEHIMNLPEVVSAACNLLNNNTGGGLYVSIPNEGRFLWKAGYMLSTGREFKKRYNLDYGLLMKYEHVNTADEIEEILKYFFREIRMKLFGISKTFAFYRYYECKTPDLDKAAEYLKMAKQDREKQQ
jgi:2-polyprenyl-3-methyl-5-hydroxy-6-metoxy-1,4-benzoquinol methylase